MSERLNEWMNEWMDEWIMNKLKQDEWMNGCTIELKKVGNILSLNGWLIDWMNWWMDGWMNKQMSEWTNAVWLNKLTN